MPLKNNIAMFGCHNVYCKIILGYRLLLIACVGLNCYQGKKSEFRAGSTTAKISNNDTWKKAGPGGGGAMFNPQVSPFNPRYAFVSCDMTGSFVTYNGGESWTMFNLHGPVDFYVFDPLDSNIVYANSVALFKSTDKGATWNLFYPSPSVTMGLVARGDHAEEILITRDSSIKKVHAFAIDPENSRKLYAVISMDKSIAMYISDDGGLNWVKEKDVGEKAKNIYILPSSPKDNRTLYITGSSGVLVKQAGNWNKYSCPPGVKSLTHFTAGFDKSNGKFIIYAISGRSYFNPGGTRSGIYYSENGGYSWENRQDGLLAFNKIHNVTGQLHHEVSESALPEWRTIATCALHPGVVYISYNNMRSGKDTAFIGVAKSDDYGKNWSLCWKDIIKTKSGNVSAYNFKTGWIDERFGPTWGENPFSIGVSPTNPEVCYASDFGRTVKTFDGGTTWEQVYTRKIKNSGWLSRGLDVTTGYHIVSDPFARKHIFMCNTDIGLMESNDKGITWASATKNNGVPDLWKNSTYWLEFDPDIKGRAWAVMSNIHDLPRPKMFRDKGINGYDGGVLVTENGGRNWKATSDAIGGAAITHLLIDPGSNKEARTLYVTAFGKGVYKSVDGGKTWQQKNKGIAGKEPFAWRISRREKDGILFLIISRRSEDGSIGNPGDGAVYRSSDGAESWERVKLPPQTNGPTSIVADEENDNFLILSAWGRPTNGKFSPDIGGGIYLSRDDGRSWIPVIEKDQHIHDITYDKRNKRYYACGFNGSAYRSGDIGQTWQRIRGYNFKWGKRVDMDVSDPGKIYIITFGGGIWYGPANGDNNAVEDVVTPVLAY